jgi:hypothetical protein
MTQHIFNSTTKDGRQVEVLAGWDRPLQGFFMVIEDLENDDGYIFNNLDLEQPHPKSFDGFEQSLKDFGIPIPQGLVAELNQDRLENLGNKRKIWEPTSHADVQAKVNEADLSWIGTSEKARAVDVDGKVVAVRYGRSVSSLAEIIDRLKGGECGDDLPILMSDFGCDYDAACDAVFGQKHDVSIEMLESACLASVAANKLAAAERFKNLIFPLHDVWPLVHGSKDESLKEECTQIMRACGDFQDGFFPNEPFNDRIYAALVRCDTVLSRLHFLSTPSMLRAKKAISMGAGVADSLTENEPQSPGVRPRA